MLLSAWEKKLADAQLTIFHSTLDDGIWKLKKYYCKFDNHPAIPLSLLLHPYFSFKYFKHKWGGEEEQQAEIENGNPYAKN